MFERHIGDVNPVAVSPDGMTIASAGEDKTISLWRVDRAEGPRLLIGHENRVFSLDFSHDGSLLASGSWDGTSRIWDTSSGNDLQRIDHAPVWSVAFSSDGSLLASACADGTVRLWNVTNKRTDRVFGEARQGVMPPLVSGQTSVAISQNRQALASGDASGTILLWDTQTGQALQTLQAHKGPVFSLCFSPDSGTLASGGFDQSVKLWDVSTGALVQTLVGHVVPRHIEKGASVAFNSDGTILASGGTFGTIRLWEAATGREIAAFTGHSGAVASVRFGRDDSLLVAGSNDATATLWAMGDPSRPEKVCGLYSFPDHAWAVIDDKGRFDASNAGDIEWLHWVVGTEPVNLSQLKKLYYLPGLLARLFGYAKQLPDVKSLSAVRLYPQIELVPADPADPQLRVRLRNRGGGIGKVVIAINGKEMIADARGKNFSPQAAEQVIEVDLANHPFLIPGNENLVTVRAYETEDYLVSRDCRRVYLAPEKTLELPDLWAVVVGISDYEGERLSLRFADKDAKDIAKAIDLGGRRLFGPERVHLALLTASPKTAAVISGKSKRGRANEGADETRPTRGAILQAFEQARQAKSTDILVIYLAGHGVVREADEDYYYLTTDAASGDLEDRGIRDLTSISSSELTELIQRIPALKQVVILDTCGAGRFAEGLGKARRLEANQIRALDRMKDRMGLFVLAGSTADAVSYESSRYGQGLLTYSLLFAMHGGGEEALREGEFLDVAKLFGFAADKVPQLAAGIGGIQRPVVAQPSGNSFDIGQLIEEDKKQITIASVLPVVLRASFQDESRRIDHLGLAKRVNGVLRERSGVKGRALLVFVDSDEFPGAFLLVGRYRVDGDEIHAVVSLFQDGEPKGDFGVEGTRSDLAQLAERIVDELLKRI
ncbi:MAG: caspase family protein [Chloroflexi bacterium]|nr:caspase family protein [Chloroflexota bacterium]